MVFVPRWFVVLALSAWLAISGTAGDADAESPDGASARGRTYSNPILSVDYPADPDVILVDGTYYLYPTTHGRGYDAWTSTDLVNWKPRGSVFEAPHGGAWAPDVFHDQRGDGKFYLYYTDSEPDAPAHGPWGKRIGVAVSDSPLGPFVDKKVLATGSIDAHLFQDEDGRYYLYYVEITGGFKIFVQRMSDPLTKSQGRAGERIEVLHPTERWEKVSGEVTEGPFMLKHKGLYYLMYSGTGADSPNYGIGYATSKSPVGPFEKYAGNPIVHRSENTAGQARSGTQASAGTAVYGPGHHGVVDGPDGKMWMVYHQKSDGGTDYRRFLALDPIWFDEGGKLQARVTRGTDERAPGK